MKTKADSTLTLAVVFGAIASVASMAASAATVTFQQGVSGYSGTQDTELREDNTATNYGGNATLTIDGADTTYATNALLRFDNIFGAGLGQIPVGATISSASLTFYMPSGGQSVDMMQMLTDWSQSGATWASLVNGVQADGVEASLLRTLAGRAIADTPDSSLLGTSGTSVTIDVTTELQDWASGTSNYGWGFIPSSPSYVDGVDFDTSENSTISWRPQLTVTYQEQVQEQTPVPMLSTWMMGLLSLMLGGAGLFAMRRFN